jgi:OOP family OmpA-OmpF porin
MSQSLSDKKQLEKNKIEEQMGSRPMEELRRLLIGPEKKQLDHILSRLNDPDVRAREVGEILAQALRWRTAKDDQVARAIQPAIEETLLRSVRENPKILVDVIFPVMGPALRKAISASIMSMIQSLNQLITHSVSVRGIQWRFEALKTRKPFAEIVLLHTLVFRIEQIFLIHTETGLMVQHLSVEDIDHKDPDLVAGMLTAIQDFIKDSFSANDELIDTLRIGNQRSIWLEQGSNATLAAVIQGTPPLEYRSDMRECIDWIHLKHGDSLSLFNGDTGPFDVLSEELKPLFQFQLNQKTKKISPLLWVVLGALLSLPIIFGVNHYQKMQAWRQYTEILKEEPGIVVTDTYKKDGKYVVEGLRDPLAKDPALLLSQSKAASLPVRAGWQTYHAMEEPFLLSRATAMLKPPSGISLSLSGSELTATGTADHLWIMHARRLAQLLPGISAYRDDTVIDLDLSAFHDVAAQLESTRFLFFVGRIDLMPGQENKLKEVVELAHRLQTIGADNRIAFEILVLGHADGSGSDMFNIRLSRLRAEKMTKFLITAGVAPGLLKAMGLSTSLAALETQAERAQAEAYRSVTFKLHITPSY